ncbi:hypothetical protein PR202_gb29739 [Eleusine coracana subsp. coracana]|uniref:KIB1-4 beta-propeller domain-containing protein n=1 Tax=Eleusine coracana subsp. coracana TaxID=191504 RepID=A0AAV5G2M8_ELECO|nr:hypothetical protein PR202_gb29739 [Eleusine coracana subsp. coracana]
MAAWAGLRLDLVGRILGHLPCLSHRAAFDAVCFNWRVAEAQHPPQLPWLLLPSTAANAPVFSCIRYEGPHPAFLPDDVRTARCCGSHPGGWLVLVLRNHQQQGGGYALPNLHTGENLAVPGFLNMPNDIGGEVVVTVLGAALSAAPTEDGACLAVVLANCPSPIAFWRPGMEMEHLYPPMPFQPHERASWRDMLPGPGGDVNPRREIADVIYYAGHGLEGFHVLTDAEEVLVYIPELGPDDALTTRLVTYRFSGPPRDAGSSAVVHHQPLPPQLLRRAHDGGEAGNHGDRQAQWKRVWFPDNVVVMLGRCSSMAFVSPAVALNGIYCWFEWPLFCIMAIFNAWLLLVAELAIAMLHI